MRPGMTRVGEAWLGKAPTVLNEETPVRMQYFRQVITNGVNGIKLLDLGVGGMGTIAEALAKQGASVTVVDRHERTLELAQAHAHKAGLPIAFQQAEFHQVTF